MSEQSMPMPEGVMRETPGEAVGRSSRFVISLCDAMIFAAMTAFGGFLGLFIEDALVNLDYLAMAEGSKHGNYGTEFMLAGAFLGWLWVAVKTCVRMVKRGQSVGSELMRAKVVTASDAKASLLVGFVLRMLVPMIVIAALLWFEQFTAAIGFAVVVAGLGLITGRGLNDMLTGTRVVWADDVDEIPSSIHVSEALRRFVDAFGRFGSWWIVPVVIITCFDVIARKAVWTNEEGIRVGIQIFLVENFGRFFDSTLLQEMEWHSHTILFAFVLGYGYIKNTHVRVDLLRERFDFRLKAKLEFFGLTFFLIPYCIIVAYFAGIYAMDSYAISEISASQVGLPMRWVIKTLLTAGLLATVAAGISVWLQVAVALWGPRNLRFDLMTLEWPEDAGSTIEGKERLDLSKVEDELEKRARASGHYKGDSSDS
ncbi:MAG: TRAP transporter small permease subunit [Pseudomonadota bacterium]